MQEWRTTRYTAEPRTHLLVIDVQTDQEASISLVDQGFAEPRAFDGQTLRRVRARHDLSGTREETEEVAVEALDGWRPVGARLQGR